MKRLVTLAILVVLTASLTAVRGDDKDKDKDKGNDKTVITDSAYYPLKVGNTWTYKGPANTTLINKVAKHEKVGEVMCARIETSVGGNTVAYEHISVTKDGIFRHSLNGMAADKPILIMKLPPKDGDAWEINAKFGTEMITGKMSTKEEKGVTVPAGKYDAYVAGGKLESSGQAIEAANYFVKDIGIAKIKMNVAGTDLVIELEKFEPAK